jgi:hypothetical protein
VHYKFIAAICISLLTSACDKQETARQPEATCGPAPTSSPTTQEESKKQVVDEAALADDNVSKVVTQLSWHLCNARANGWIDDAFYRTESIALREGVFRKMGLPIGRSGNTPEQGQAEAVDTPASNGL